MALNTDSLVLWLKDYWYIVAIIFLIFFIWIFTKQDTRTKQRIKKFMTGPFLMIFFVGIVWFIIAHFGPIINIKLAHFMMPMLILVGVCIYILIMSLKYKTPQFLALNMHGSYSSLYPLKSDDGFLIFGLDSIDADGLHLDGADRVAVVREETAELLLRGAVSLSNMSRVDLYDLTPDVVAKIRGNKHLKDAKEFYYGWFDNINKVDWDFAQLRKLQGEKSQAGKLFNLIKTELKVTNPKVSTLYWSYMNLSKLYNKLEDYFKMNIDNTDTGVEHIRRIRESFEPPRDQGYSMDKGSEEH